MNRNEIEKIFPTLDSSVGNALRQLGDVPLRPKDEHFHGEVRSGCLTVLKRREKAGEEGHLLDIWECLTHGVEICRCGWEWGWHLNTKS